MEASPTPSALGRSGRPWPSSSTRNVSAVRVPTTLTDTRLRPRVPRSRGRGARHSEPEVVQGRWPRRSSWSHPGRRGRSATPVAAECSSRCGTGSETRSRRGLDLQADTGERRSDTVVQITAQPPAILLGGGDQLGPALLQPLGEPEGRDRFRDLVADDGQHLPVTKGHLCFPGTGGHAQRAHDLAVVPHRQLSGGASRTADRRDRRCAGVVAEVQRRRAEPQRVDDDRAHAHRHLGKVHALSKSGRGGPRALGRVGAVAVERPVHAAVEPHAEWVEQHAAHRGGGGGGHRRATRQQRRGDEEQGDVDAGQADGEAEPGSWPGWAWRGRERWECSSTSTARSRSSR